MNKKKLQRLWPPVGLVMYALFLMPYFFSACSTLPKFSGEADLCGLIVDENNSPVKDFIVFCRNDMETYRTALTDENGMFVVHDVTSGVYKISGRRKNFRKLDETEFLFTDRNRIFCCQIESIEGTFKSVEKLMLRGERKNAEELLDKICYDKKTPQEAVILVYKFFLTEKQKEKKKLIAALRKIGRIEDVDYSKYADSMEVFINEN